ncbi:MAG: VOC family protein [Acidobacteria bacterium]|nr:VOC family protein [Acidobacteriota bacterium]
MLVVPVHPSEERPCPPRARTGRSAISSAFYKAVFGWTIRVRGDGRPAFDDAVGEVSGAFIVGRPPSAAPGMLLYIMVDSVEATVEVVKAHGGKIVQPLGVEVPEITARLADPAGNVLGLYQEPKQSPGDSK